MAQNWNVETNWTAGIPGVDKGVNTAVFDGGKSTTPCTDNVAATLILNTLTVTNTYGSLIDLSGHEIQVGSNGPPRSSSSLASGTIDLNNGILALEGGDFNWSGGNITDSSNNINRTDAFDLINGANAVLNITGSAGILGAELLVGSGDTVNVNPSSDLTVAHKANIVNGGTITFQADKGFVVNADGAGTMTNNGTVQKTAGSGTTTIALAFTNTNTFSIQSGTINLTASNPLQSSGVTTLGTATANGNLTVNGTYTLIGSSNLNGTGTITGNVSAGSATVHPGPSGSPGTLTITGNYSQGATSTLSINIDASGNIGNIPSFSTISLAGTCTVTRDVNYTPSSGSLTFLQGTSISGDFTVKTVTNNTWTSGGNQYHFVFDKHSQSYTLDVTRGPGGNAPTKKSVDTVLASAGLASAPSPSPAQGPASPFLASPELDSPSVDGVFATTASGQSSGGVAALTVSPDMRWSGVGQDESSSTLDPYLPNTLIGAV
jgi:hypothetical protein